MHKERRWRVRIWMLAFLFMTSILLGGCESVRPFVDDAYDNVEKVDNWIKENLW